MEVERDFGERNEHDVCFRRDVGGRLLPLVAIALERCGGIRAAAMYLALLLFSLERERTLLLWYEYFPCAQTPTVDWKYNSNTYGWRVAGGRHGN